MIKLFRKIRQKSINEKLPKLYLAYAIGEIILVVVGILIALQVNNWNESRKTRNTEITVLKELIDGLVSDSGTIYYNIDKHKQAVNSCKIILKALNENGGYNDSLAYHFAATHYYTVFYSSLGAYESLKSMGFETISSKDVRNEIINLYDKWYGVLKENENFLKEDIQHIKRTFNQYHFDKFQLFDPKAGADHFYNGSMIPNNFNQLKRNQQYRYFLRSLLASHSVFLMFNEIAISKIELVLDNINQEVDRLK